MHTPMYLLHGGDLQAFHIDTKKDSPEIQPPPPPKDLCCSKVDTLEVLSGAI